MKKNAVYATQGNIWKSILLSLPMLLMIVLFTTGGKPDFSTLKTRLPF